MNDRVSAFIIIFTVINVAACLWLLWWTAKTRVDQSTQHDESNGPQRTGHVWDGDLEEYNNPLPRWWLGLFIATVLFSAAYLWIYPGLGNYLGAQRWTSVGEYEAQERNQRARLEAQLAGVQSASLAELASNGSAMATAKNLFGANCSTCHGSDARGAKGFPNLTDRDWLWGNAHDSIYESIANGRHAVMPPMGAALGRDGVNEVASYVLSLSGVQAPPEWVAAGKERFATLCAACHGADATGNASLGAPNLADKIWLFGGDFRSVSATIANGRESIMPAHAPLLGDIKVKLLAAYVLSLSDSTRPQVAHNEPPFGETSQGAAGGAGRP